jgi:hypothetical protein
MVDSNVYLLYPDVRPSKGEIGLLACVIRVAVWDITMQQ